MTCNNHCHHYLQFNYKFYTHQYIFTHSVPGKSMSKTRTPLPITYLLTNIAEGTVERSNNQ